MPECLYQLHLYTYSGDCRKEKRDYQFVECVLFIQKNDNKENIEQNRIIKKLKRKRVDMNEKKINCMKRVSVYHEMLIKLCTR